jgi:hypothetical protein
VHAGLDPRLELSHRAIGLGESLGDLDFELGTCLMRDVRDPSKNATRLQAHSDPIRVVKDNRVIDSQVERGGRGHSRGHPSRNV